MCKVQHKSTCTLHDSNIASETNLISECSLQSLGIVPGNGQLVLQSGIVLPQIADCLL